MNENLSLPKANIPNTPKPSAPIFRVGGLKPFRVDRLQLEENFFPVLEFES